MSQGLTSLLWFALILALIPAALWLLKRTPMGGAAAHGILRSVAALPLSASQRIVTVEVGHGEARRWLVLGVTPQSITTLHTMLPEADLPGATGATSTPPPPGFAQLFAKLRRGPGDSDAR
ncbi:MAG: flagellar biosynthetic protein FliO [Pseudomonadota bacterium]|nr:flagellar biosynthetic protein FliO [Pseudomonadota bacterium]